MKRPTPWLVARTAAIALIGILVASSAVLLWSLWRADASSRPDAASEDRAHRLAALPRVILWAWERPEDLRFLPANKIGVSFLAETVTLSGRNVRVRPRLQTLRVNPVTPLLACARIETDAKLAPELTAGQVSATASALAALGRIDGVVAVQVDFDATISQRHFYADVLRDFRRRLPPDMPLSITALASWCMDDPWIAGLPVDEAVPMLFRMGPDAEDARLLLGRGRDFSLSVCRTSVGISTDEPIRDLPAGRRRYVFRPQGWSPGAVGALFAQENQR
ncbi:MAG TPA: DUF3142 domain-containing protein [Terriglobia bacterium]|nr:DUF3142 domain-containing protein [Terriglobia bacterium]